MKAILLAIVLLSTGISYAESVYLDRESGEVLLITADENNRFFYKLCESEAAENCENLGRDGGYEEWEVYQLSLKANNLLNVQSKLGALQSTAYYLSLMFVALRVVSLARAAIVSGEATAVKNASMLSRVTKYVGAKLLEFSAAMALVFGMDITLDELVITKYKELKGSLGIGNQLNRRLQFRLLNVFKPAAGKGMSLQFATNTPGVSVQDLAVIIDKELWGLESCPIYQANDCDNIKSFQKQNYEKLKQQTLSDFPLFVN